MKILVDKVALNQALSVVSKVPGRSHVEAHKSVWIEAGVDGVTVEVMDATLDMVLGVEASVEIPGVVGVPAKQLAVIVSRMPAGDVSLALNDSGALEISQGRIRFEIPVTDPEWRAALPAYPDGAEGMMPAEYLRDLIRRVGLYVCNDDTQEVLSVMYLLAGKGGSVRALAMDGHQMAAQSFENDSLASMLPKAGLQLNSHVLKVLDGWLDKEARFAVDEETKRVFVKNGSAVGRLSFPLTSYQCPNADNILKKAASGDVSIRVSRMDLMDALGRASILESKEYRAVLFRLSPEGIAMSMSTASRYEDYVSASVAGEAVSSLAFPCRGLATALGNCVSEEVLLQVSGETSPCLLTGESDEGYQVVVMPMMLPQVATEE